MAFELPDLTALAGDTGIGGFGGQDWMSGLGVRGMPDVGVSGGGGSFWSDLGKGISDWAKPVSQILGAGTSLAQIPLAIEGLNVSRRGQQSLERGQQLAERAAAPMIAAQERLIPAGTDALLGGPLPPQLEAMVQQKVNAQRQQMMQQLLGMGMDQATASAMIEGQMKQMENQLRIEAAQSLMTGGQGGIQAGGVGVQGGQLGGLEMNAANQALEGANQSMYRLFGGMG